MIGAIVTRFKRKLRSIVDVNETKCDIRRKKHSSKSKVLKPQESDLIYNTTLSPRAIGIGECAKTDVEWPEHMEHNPNTLDKFTRIISTNNDLQIRSNKINDREEIRKKLANGCDTEDYYSTMNSEHARSSLHLNLQSGSKLRPSLAVKSTKTRSSHSLGHIDVKESDFLALQSTLQTEARIALAQAKEVARLQMQRERRGRSASPVSIALRRSARAAAAPLPPARRRLSRFLLSDYNTTQLKLIVDQLQCEIKTLNENLMSLLMTRDELHMTQDSKLVDIEDLTRYLGMKERKRTNRDGLKSSIKKLTTLVKK